MRYVYLLKSMREPARCYIGVARDLDVRLQQHNDGLCFSTKKFRPWKIVYSEQYWDDEKAIEREKQLKGWSRLKKESLITGDFVKLKRLAKRRNR